MWRSILALFLMHSLAAAQAPANDLAPQQIPPAKLSETAPAPPPKLEDFAVFDAIRQGTAEEVVIQFYPVGSVSVSNSPVSGVAPLKLDIQSEEGLTVGKVEYPKTFVSKVTFRGEPIRVTNFPVVRLKLHADRNASLGAHVLSGKITFQTIGLHSTLGPVQQMDVQVPITVVEHNARVNRSANFPPGPLNPGWIVLMIVLLPIIIPLWFLSCTIGGQDCRC